MNLNCKRILKDYEEARITSTAFIVDFLNASDRADLDEAMESLTPDLIEQIREFVETHRPDSRVFRGPPLQPRALMLAKDVFVGNAKSA